MRSEWSTRFTSAPSLGVATVTRSPTTWVKPSTRRVPVFRRREHRAEEQHESVRILVGGADRLRHEVERIAADHRQRARAVEHEALRPVDAHREIAAANVVDPEPVVEEADERTDRARRVVVLGLAEEQRAAALEVAQVDVVAERRADGLARGC